MCPLPQTPQGQSPPRAIGVSYGISGELWESTFIVRFFWRFKQRDKLEARSHPSLSSLKTLLIGFEGPEESCWEKPLTLIILSLLDRHEELLGCSAEHSRRWVGTDIAEVLGQRRVLPS